MYKAFMTFSKRSLRFVALVVALVLIGATLSVRKDDFASILSTATPDKDVVEAVPSSDAAASSETKSSPYHFPFNETGEGAAFDLIVNGTPLKPKACFVSLVRNKELWPLAESITSVQDRFNKKFDYPWVFLNEEPFSDEFKETILSLVPNAQFGLIPKEHWSYPEYISESKAAQTRKDMKDIIYGDSESYRHMCRFQSGFFFQHPLLAEYDWYWRVEPSTKLAFM